MKHLSAIMKMKNRCVSERNHENEEQMRMFLKDWGPMPDSNAGEVTLPDLDAQFEAIVSVKPKALSSIMGVFSPE